MIPRGSIPGFRPVPFTGVIYVMAEASRLGYRYAHPDWCNLGQGQPETGPRHTLAVEQPACCRIG